MRRREPVRIVPPSGVQRFGHSIAGSGDILVVGAPDTASNNGTAYTYRRTEPGKWERFAGQLTGGPGYGVSIALSGTALVIGAQLEQVDDLEAAGTLHFYALNGSTWSVAEVTTLGVTGAVRELGSSVALSGASAAGASDNFNEVHTYSRTADGSWTEDPGSFLEADDGIAFIEGSLALDGNWLAIGAHNGTAGPATFIYRRNEPGEAWTAPSGGDVMLQAPGMFADSVALAGRTLIVNGEPVRAFERAADGTWTNVPLPSDSLGPVALGQSTVVVGSQQDTFNAITGEEVRVLRRHPVSQEWQNDPSSPLPASAGVTDQFGMSVATTDRFVFVGAPSELGSGVVYIYD